MAGSTTAPASAHSTMLRSCGRLIGVSRGTSTRGFRSFSITSAARSTRFRDRPLATPASDFIEHGTITMPFVGRLPLAIVAPRSRLLMHVEPAPANAGAVPLFEVRHQPLEGGLLAQLVDQQAAPVVADDEIQFAALFEQRRHGPDGIERAARAGDGHGVAGNAG